MVDPAERRQAVIDLGSNSFRLVVFTWQARAGAWWKRTDEIHEAVRIGEGLDATGDLGAEPMERALRHARAVRALLPRDRASPTCAPWRRRRSATPRNQDDVPRARARERTWLEIEVLDARGGGALRLPRRGQLDDARRRRRARHRRRLDAAHARREPDGGRAALVAPGRGAHDRALPATARARQPKQVKALRAHVQQEARGRADWLDGAGAHGRRLVGVGGAVRNLAAAAERRGRPARPRRAGLRRRRASALGELIERVLELPAAERGDDPRHQAGPRRRHPGRRGRDRHGAGGRRLRRASRRRRPACARASSSRRCSRARTRRCSTTCAARPCSTSPRSTTRSSRTPSTSRRSRSRCGTRWPRPAATTATRPSATCCGPRRCCTTSARPSTTTTTTSTRAT